jgi:hypothetical protein
MGNFFGKMMGNFVVDRTTNWIKDAAIAGAMGFTVNLIARSLGLEDTLVGRVLSVGVPMMTMVAGDDPSITDSLFDRSDKRKKDKEKNKGKEKDKSSLPGRKEAETDFFDVFGPKGHKMNKVIAEETGATEDEVNGIMSLFLPTFEEAIDEDDVPDENALGGLFRTESEKAKKESPSLSRMAMKMVF